MSSFIKKLLFISDGKNKPAAAPTKSSLTSLPNDSFVELLLKECFFRLIILSNIIFEVHVCLYSSDEIGLKMSVQWNTFNDLVTETKSEHTDLEDRKLKVNKPVLDLHCGFNTFLISGCDIFGAVKFFCINLFSP
jgi:hypothetical protein